MMSETVGETPCLLPHRFPERPVNLTTKTVSALTALPEGKTDHIEWDDELKGFGLRLRLGSGGRVNRTWITQYRRAGATRRMLLGSAAVLSADAARAAAKKVLAAVTLGHDPQGDRVDRRSKDQTSLRAVIEEYLKAKAVEVRPRTLVEITRYLTGRYFKPLHVVPVDQVTRKDIAARLVVISRESSSITAARARAAVSAFYGWAMQMGLVEANPVIGTIQPKNSEGRSRVLSDAELAAVWGACRDDDYGRIVRLLILSGCRRQEVGGMRWSEFDTGRGTWLIPAARAKNEHEHELPLPRAAWDIIEGVPQLASRDQLFGARAERGFSAWCDGKQELNRRLGTSVAPFVLHDIRRSVATGMANIGIQPHIIEAVLNHQSGHKRGVAGIYNRSSYQREMKAALALWADHVRSLVDDGGEHRLIPFVPASAS